MGSLELPADKPSSNMYFLLLLLGLATSSPVPQLTRVTRQTSNLLLLQPREGQTLAESRQDFQDIDVPAGEAVDIFYRYRFFCDDLSELMKHYFHDFSAEGVRDPHRLYTGSWRTPTIVKYFGLSDATLHSDAGFVLVKLLKPRLEVKTEGSPVLKPDAGAAFSRIEVGNQQSVKDFVENYGSHYIRSLTIG